MRFFILFTLLLTTLLQASIGEIRALRGDAVIIRSDKIIKAAVGSKIEEKDIIKSSKNSKLQIIFNDKTIISLGANSNFKIDEYLFSKTKPVARFSVGHGFFKSITGKIGKISHKNFKIKTKNATIGVRGTTIIGKVEQKRDIIACSQGQIVVSSAGSSVVVNAGERTIVEHLKAPKQAHKLNRVILKQLEKKSDPKVEDNNDNKIAKKSKTESTKEKTSQIDEAKESEKFEPWQDDKRDQTLDDIKSIIGENKPSYKGEITEGTTSNGAIQKGSRVDLEFDLGSGDMRGKMKFKDNREDYNIKIDGKVRGSGDFNFNSNNGYDGGGKGKLSGDRYQNANGDFNFKESDFATGRTTNQIDGKFQTKRVIDAK